MLVEGPDYLSCPIHELRSMAAAASPAAGRFTGRLIPEAEAPIRMAYTQALGFGSGITGEELEGALSTLQAVLPTPEQRRKEQDEARIEPPHWEGTERWRY